VLLLVFVTVILVLFAAFNTQTVQVSLVIGDVQAPLLVALVIAALMGGLVAALLDAVLRVRRGRRRTWPLHRAEGLSAIQRPPLWC